MVLWLIFGVLVLILATLVWIAFLILDQTELSRADFANARYGFGACLDRIAEDVERVSSFFRAVKQDKVVGLTYKSNMEKPPYV